MFKHNIIIAIRNISKYWKYSVINIGGLAIGMASFIFIILYIEDELKYDKYHEKADRIFRVNRLYNANNVNEDAATCPFPLSTTLETAYPDIVEKTVRFFNSLRPKWYFDYTNSQNEIIKFYETNFYLVDSTVFDVFTFPFIDGDPATALDRPNTIVLTASTAKRYFGEVSAIGKSLRLEEGPIFEVTGVIKDIPSQSHFRIDMMASLNTFRQFGNGQLPNDWVWNPCWTYVLLKEGIDPKILDDRFPDFFKTYYTNSAIKDQEVSHYLQPLRDIHLKSHHVYEMHTNSDILYVYILSIIAGIVLFLACINFMNLATASSAGRAREIGVKKVFGGLRSGLTLQFLIEALVQAFFALILSLVIIEILLPFFNGFTGKVMAHNFIFSTEALLFFLLLVLVVGVLAGTYPAFFLSSFQPLRVLKGSFKSGVKSGMVRKVLVVVQFSISISLIIGSLIVFSQLSYLRNTELGFDRERIITFENTGQLFRNYEAFKQELLRNKDIQFVTGAEDVLGVNHNTRSYEVEGLNPGQQYYIPTFMVDWDFVETFGIKVVEGRSFSRDFPGDTINAVMINERMVRDMGWTNQEAIGKKIKSVDGDERVIGVFKDFYAMSLHFPVNNFILDIFRRPWVFARSISVKTNTDNYKEVISFIEEKWKQFVPSRPFEYRVFDSQLRELYNDEEKFGKFSVLLTFLAIVIASMGLTGLTLFLAEQKTKEIGIRKVLGASTSSIINLMFKEFIILLIISNLISWPITYIVTSNWLDNYSKHIGTNWWFYLISGLFTIAIALVITGVRALKTSRINPAETLKYE